MQKVPMIFHSQLEIVICCVFVRFEQFNKKYLRRFLIREGHQAPSSILRVYQELERREQRGDEEAPPWENYLSDFVSGSHKLKISSTSLTVSHKGPTNLKDVS